MSFLFYPGSEVPLTKKAKQQSEEREPLVTCDKAFQMVGPIKLSHSTRGIWFDWHLMNIFTNNTETCRVFYDKKYLRCAALGNQVHTGIVSKKCGNEEEP